jgi:hypothetical protein
MLRRMKSLLFLTFLCAAIWSTGCGRSLYTEERVVELPRQDPGATLSRASQIGQALIAAGFFAEVRQRFPQLTEQQFQGLYLKWDEDTVQGGHRVFLATGIRAPRRTAEGKAVADFCESVVRAAVADAFPNSPGQPTRTPQDGE